jgi:hypothetical protein
VANLKNIAEGWVNFIKSSQPDRLSEEMKIMAEKRANICKTCPSLLFSEFTIMGKNIFKYKCKECGCAFPMMTYAKLKKCPKGKWPDDIGT